MKTFIIALFCLALLGSDAAWAKAQELFVKKVSRFQSLYAAFELLVQTFDGVRCS